MIRAYAIGLGAGTHVLTHVPWFILMRVPPGELARGIMMGAAWVINIVVAEAILRAMDRSKRARTVARHVSPFRTYRSPIDTRSTT